ncbi:MAG TPA: response regulator transcription factor [Pseudobdellovibrionaceae bacterium]|jgi:two-component system phosphate regulon response regulator PhoB
MSKILLIDDYQDIGELVTRGLRPYPVTHVYTIGEAEQALKSSSFEVFIIDVNLPDGNGFDFCVSLGQNPLYQNVPKIILSGQGEVTDKVYGLNCGADDYVTKPFDVVELRARVERFLRRLQSPMKNYLNVAGFSFDTEFLKCYVIDGRSKKDLELTPTEFRIFLTLAKSEGRLVTRRALEKAAWEPQGVNIKIRGIDTHIAHLRKKLGAEMHMIVSVYGQGYSFNTQIRG